MLAVVDFQHCVQAGCNPCCKRRIGRCPSRYRLTCLPWRQLPRHLNREQAGTKLSQCLVRTLQIGHDRIPFDGGPVTQSEPNIHNVAWPPTRGMLRPRSAEDIDRLIWTRATKVTVSRFASELTERFKFTPSAALNVAIRATSSKIDTEAAFAARGNEVLAWTVPRTWGKLLVWMVREHFPSEDLSDVETLALFWTLYSDVVEDELVKRQR
ncbi:hypothetical protein BH11PSE13_BH11PSE13_35550 [soil metagenome]